MSNDAAPAGLEACPGTVTRLATPRRPLVAFTDGGAIVGVAEGGAIIFPRAAGGG